MARGWLWSADKHFVYAYMAGWGTEPQTVIRCEHCQAVIVSRSTHDMNGCRCPMDDRIWIDGGQDYLRIMWGGNASFSQHVSAPAEKEDTDG